MDNTNEVRNVSDTALWAAHFRAEESKRPDALFRDPYAEKLGAARGAEMAKKLPQGLNYAWAWVARTYLFDQFLEKEIADGADLIVNCAAGLDARPYRMKLPATLQWIEADLPEILGYKEKKLADDRPNCQLERIAVNLADESERRSFFARLADRGKRGIVITEGLIIYLSPQEAAGLAQDLSRVNSLQHWILDMHSPRLLKMMQRNTGKALEKVGASFKFGPPEGPEYFLPYGWRPIQARSFLRAVAPFGRPPFYLRLLAKLPEPNGMRPGNRPWAGACILQKDGTAS